MTQPERLKALAQTVSRALPQRHENPQLDAFYALVREYPARGGKRLRGELVLLSTAAHGGDWQQALPVAAALELFQNWVLIHDDIEDDSEERRGLPALHRQVGMPVALNVGDALHVYMWQLLHRLEGFSQDTKASLLGEFEWIIQRTAEGQHLDLSWVAEQRFDVSADEYLAMVTLKTAYYTVVGPLRLGAICAGREPDARLSRAGCDLGVAFQIRDDVLNLLPSEGAAGAVRYGKEFAGDLYEAKRTLILAHFFAHAGAEARAEVEASLAKARAEKTAEDISRVLVQLEQSGSLQYAQRQAEARAVTGLTKLRAALEALPGEAGVRELTGLLESMASRRH